jgi:hypothetical protein
MDNAIEVNVDEIIKEMLSLKNQIVKMEMVESEIKAKIIKLTKNLKDNRPAAGKIWEELKTWASKK